MLTLVGWSSVPLFLKFFAAEIDAWTSNGWRYGLSALLWLPPLVIHWIRGTTPRGLWRAALWPSVWNIPAQACFALAFYYAQPGLAIFSMRMQIVFLYCGAAVLFPAERRIMRSPLFIAGAGLVLVGTLATVALEPGGLGGGSGIGVALAGVAGLLYALYALAVRKTMMGVDPLTGFAAVNQLTALGMVGAMLALGRDIHTHAWNGGAGALGLGPWHFTLLILSAVVGIGLGHTLYFLSIRRLGLAVSTAVVQLQPVVVTLASMALFGEVMTPAQWATGCMALVGAAGVLVAQTRTRPEPAA